LYALPNIIRVVKSRRMRWSGHVSCMEEVRNAYRILVRKPERKRLLERCKAGWEDNVSMGL